MSSTTSAAGVTPTWRRSLGVALPAFLATRLPLLLIGAYAYRLHGMPAPWLRMWLQWDAHYYFSILQHGYVAPVATTGQETGQSNVNFFPMLPLGAAALTALGVPALTAAVAFANLSLLAAAVLLHRLAAARADIETADWSVAALLTLPGSFVLSGFLTEPLFLALSIAAAYAAQTGRMGRAALACCPLAVTRLTGVVLPAGLALDWLLSRLRGRSAPYQTLFLLALTPLPLTAFAAYMYHRFGDALTLLHSNFVFWEQRFSVPLQNFVMFAWTGEARLQIESVLGLAMLVALILQRSRFSAGEWLFMAISIASFASSQSASPSLVRYMLGLYPLYLALGRLAARYSAARWLMASGALVNGALMADWAQGGDALI